MATELATVTDSDDNDVDADANDSASKTATRTTCPGCASWWWRWRRCQWWGGERDGNRRLLRWQLYARRLLQWWHFYNGLCGTGKI
jgi:hypothetical protein